MNFPAAALTCLAAQSFALAAVYHLEPPPDLGECRIREATARGSSMAPLIRPGEPLLILEGYYKTHEIQRHDIVAYNLSPQREPVGKIVCGIPGDRWSLVKEKTFYKIIVNGEALTNSAGETYRLYNGGQARLDHFARLYPVIPQGAYLILGDSTRPGHDSRKFGLLSGANFIGKIVRKPRQFYRPD